MTARTPENCIIHCRVSTAKQAQERDSLEAQEAIGRGVAERKGWQVLQVFREPYSGRKNRRPLVEDIVTYIKESEAPVHYYLFKGIDRLTRAGVVEYTLLKERMERLGVTVVDSYGLIQPKQNTLDHLGFEYDWSVYSPSEAAELLEAYRSKQEVRDILTRMIGAEIKLTQEGYKVRQPADGYLNQRVDIDGKKRVIEVPDPKRAHYFVEMFRLRAEGLLPDKEIAAQVTAMGYRTKPFRRWNRAKNRIIGYSKAKALTPKRLQEIIQRPIYCGVRIEKWTDGKPVRTRYPGLVSIETFNRANQGKIYIADHADGSLSVAKSGSRTPVRLRNNPLYPYKNVVLCPECRTTLLGSASRGKQGRKYPGYHCDRGHYWRVPKPEFEDTVDSLLRDLTLAQVPAEPVKSIFLTVWESREEEIAAAQELREDHVRELQTKQEQALESLLAASSAVVREKLEARVNELEAAIQEAKGEDEGNGEEVTRQDVEEFAGWIEETLEHPLKVLKNPSHIERQRGYFEVIFEDLPTYDEISTGTPKLSPLFRLKSDSVGSESESVRTSEFDWNMLQKIIQRWRRFSS